MYYEEKIINEVLHHRSSPQGEFIPYTSGQLTKMYEDARAKYFLHRDLILIQMREALDKIEETI